MFNSGNGYSLADIAAVAGADGNGFGGNGAGAWWILLFILLLAGGNGFGGFFGGNRGIGTGAEINYAFDTNSTHEGIRDLSTAVANGFYALNTGVLNGFANTTAAVTGGISDIRHDLCDVNYTNLQDTNAILQAISADTMANLQNAYGLTTQMNALASQQQNCCCETQRALERDFAQLNYNLATLACDTKQATLDSTRDIITNANANTRQILDFLTQDRISALQAENQALKTAASQAAQNAYLVERLSPTANPAYIVANPYTGSIYPVQSSYAYGQCGCGCA